MKLGHWLVLVPFLAASPAALAQGGAPGWFAGIDYGEAKLDSDNFAGASNREDTSDTWSVKFGYRFNRFIAIEAGYVDVGDFSASFTGPCAGCGSTARTSIDGFLVNAIGTWPIAEHFHLKGVLGATYRDLDASYASSGVTNSWSESTTIFSFGAGIAVPINDHFEIDLDFTHYREIGLGLTLGSSVGVIDDAESNLLTLGLRFFF